MNTKTRFATAVVTLALSGLASGGVAYATSRPDGPYVGEVKAPGVHAAPNRPRRRRGVHTTGTHINAAPQQMPTVSPATCSSA